MNRQSAYLAFLQIIAECDRTSRVALSLEKYSQEMLRIGLLSLEEGGLILRHGKKRSQSFRLTVKGVEQIGKFNPLRFGKMEKSLNKIQKSYHPNEIERSMRRSDLKRMSSLGGYGVNEDEKPNLQVISLFGERSLVNPESLFVETPKRILLYLMVCLSSATCPLKSFLRGHRKQWTINGRVCLNGHFKGSG